jgi:hypothetical protein
MRAQPAAVRVLRRRGFYTFGIHGLTALPEIPTLFLSG